MKYMLKRLNVNVVGKGDEEEVIGKNGRCNRTNDINRWIMRCPKSSLHYYDFNCRTTNYRAKSRTCREDCSGHTLHLAINTSICKLASWTRLTSPRSKCNQKIEIRGCKQRKHKIDWSMYSTTASSIMTHDMSRPIAKFRKRSDRITARS